MFPPNVSFFNLFLDMNDTVYAWYMIYNTSDIKELSAISIVIHLEFPSL